MVTRWSSAWARRGALAAVLIGAAIIPGRAASSAPPACQGHHCGLTAGTVLWARRLPGTWIADGGPDGTVPSRGAAYVAANGDLAAVGLGLTVRGYDIGPGTILWTTTLASLSAGASIVSVRAWPGVVTVGVAIPAARHRAATRDEVVLAAQTGAEIRAYPAAMYGGAVAATAERTVIVGVGSVTSYANATGKIEWTQPTGDVAQAWREAQGQLYVTVAAGGYLGTAPVTALRRISLQTGAERVIRPPRAAFAGTLSGAVGGVVLFSGPRGLSAYSGETGRLLWRRPGAVPETVDPVRRTLYITTGSSVIGISPMTGKTVRGAAEHVSSGLYDVRDGVGLGLDPGARGVAWGYDIAKQRVVWTTPALPWPHYFVDLSGIGGSSDPANGTVLLASCGQLGNGVPGGSGQQCVRPELAAIRT